MISYNDFSAIEDDCAILLSSIEYQTKYAKDIIDLACMCEMDDNGFVKCMNKYSDENLKTLMILVKKISSNADRLHNRLTDFKNLVESLNNSKDTKV